MNGRAVYTSHGKVPIFPLTLCILMEWGPMGPCRQGQHPRDGGAVRQKILDPRHYGADRLFLEGLRQETNHYFGSGL